MASARAARSGNAGSDNLERSRCEVTNPSSTCTAGIAAPRRTLTGASATPPAAMSNPSSSAASASASIRAAGTKGAWALLQGTNSAPLPAGVRPAACGVRWYTRLPDAAGLGEAFR